MPWLGGYWRATLDARALMREEERKIQLHNKAVARRRKAKRGGKR